MFARFGKFANTPLGSTLIGVAVTAIVTAWPWPDVKPYLAPVWGATAPWPALRRTVETQMRQLVV